MRNRLAWVTAFGLIPLAGCGTATPCSGTSCIPVAGEYLFVLGEAVNCSIWESHVPPSSIMTLTQSGGSLSAELWPDTDDPHTLTGTLNTDNSFTLQENTQNQFLGIPYATINGSFNTISTAASGQVLYLLNGQLFLQGGSMTSSSGGSMMGSSGGLPCTGGTTTIRAEEQPAGTIIPDAGTEGGDAG